VKTRHISLLPLLRSSWLLFIYYFTLLIRRREEILFGICTDKRALFCCFAAALLCFAALLIVCLSPSLSVCRFVSPRRSTVCLCLLAALALSPSRLGYTRLALSLPLSLPLTRLVPHLKGLFRSRLSKCITSLRFTCFRTPSESKLVEH